MSGPFASEEVLLLYKNKQMKGSNLVVGLASNSVKAKDIPSAFLRTLSYILECAKMGRVYKPVSELILQTGLPTRDWCPPLWHGYHRTSPTGPTEFRISSESSMSDFSSSSEGKRCSDHSNSVESSDTANLTQLFRSAPFWCYLYSHELARAKKTPPKTSEQMIAILNAGCLPDWTPVIGLSEDVSTYNSLPPSLFMTLSSLSHSLTLGIRYIPVGLSELTRFDKFSDTRTASGTTQAGILTLNSSNSAQVPAAGKLPRTTTAQEPSNAMAMGVPALQSTMSPGGNFVAAFSAAPPPFLLPSMAPQAFIPASHSHHYGGPIGIGPHGMWYPNGYPAMPAAAAMQCQAMAGRPYSNSFSPQATMPTVSQTAQGRGSSHMSEAGALEQDLRALHLPQSLTPSTPQLLQNTANSARRWNTPLFRLFTADATRGCKEACWWYLQHHPASGSGTVMGPLDSEQMILSYSTGNLSDDHMACGSTSNIRAGTSPPHHLFERIGSLLAQVEHGGEYILLPAHEMVVIASNVSSTSTNRRQLLSGTVTQQSPRRSSLPTAGIRHDMEGNATSEYLGAIVDLSHGMRLVGRTHSSNKGSRNKWGHSSSNRN
ncbi:hypothetical protein CEUSTIGMA_g8786.t1 [Chlamydomonas eustigma]|uniref:Uncharacterized protein n=1 Tax=Chlamydomonas eustigma TaxID=1157962 RepID=A0A250XE51_9CHLO|nr:hypothetical protein CEUSTIGMA_g8786.t1 [Chlamydomonas eustigma]|eukprot:GAX81355.1 hypothetical protein CEUSTIGMA_g8786.t1 [Chlamydomonas eustigma]